MPLITEFRIPAPVSVDEYKVGQLYSCAKMSEQATTGDEGVEILKNEPYEKGEEKGQYTHKIYHLGNKMPGWIAALCPSNLKKLDEEAWNAYPYCKTVITSPYFGKNFHIIIETLHKPFDGTFEENPLNLAGDDLKKRKVVIIDAVHDPFDNKDMTADTGDIKTFKSEKVGRGPFPEGWYKPEAGTQPMMIAYKLVRIKANITLVGGKIEHYLMPYEQKLFQKFTRELTMWMDEWINLTIEDIRRLEAESKEKMRAKIEAAEKEKADKDKKKKK